MYKEVKNVMLGRSLGVIFHISCAATALLVHMYGDRRDREQRNVDIVESRRNEPQPL